MPRRVPRYVATFDSAAGMLRALGRFLRGRDYPRVGTRGTGGPHLAAPLINALPRSVREQIYIWSGWGEAIPPGELSGVDAEAISRWVVSQYPDRPYPAVAIGSASGALIHLCAALGIPWLPQTFLIPVRRSGVHPDDPIADLAWGREPGRRLLEANPDLQLHHMHDPVQDRLMIQRMTYFRVKRLRLGPVYERFLRDTLEPGGTILLAECRARWPTVRVADRHLFQFGAEGGATQEEYLHGSPRVAEYLSRYNSPCRRWPAPEPDGLRPEAEWGFEDALRTDVERLAAEGGWPVRRLLFDGPESLSPGVAELHRWWYGRRRMPANRLLAGSFIVFEPYWTLRTGSVPFWMTFNTRPSADALDAYLDRARPFDEIYAMLFSHGVDSIGLAPIERWRQILRRARRRGELIGVDGRAYPRDFAAFARYQPDLKRRIPARYPLPGALTLSQLEAFIGRTGLGDGVRWIEEGVPTLSAAP